MVNKKKELNLTIKEFDPKTQIKPNRNIMIVGPVGKSHLLKALISHLYVPFGILIRPNEFADQFFGEILPEQFKVDELTDNILDLTCERQKILCKYINAHPQVDIDPRCSLIMDDCVPDFIDLKWAKNPFFKFMFRSGKAAQLGLMFTSSFPLPIPPQYLSSVDYVFILKEGNLSHRKKLWSQYGGMFDDFKVFDKIMQMCTKDYQALVIDRTKLTDKLEQKIYYYKAPPMKDIPQFYLGNHKLWEKYATSDETLHDILQHPFDLFKN
jgi:hypothetical protein